MEKLIVVVFNDTEAKAFEGLRVLRELDSEGWIAVYEAQIITKAPGGLVRVIHNDDKLALPLIGGGTAVGALVGLLGGPVGALIGAGAGAMVGAIGDAEVAGVTDEFVNDVSTALAPGKVAVVADVVEDSLTPLDTRMEHIGGVVLRRARTLVKTTQEDRDAAAHQAEIDQLKLEREQARSERLEKIDAKIDHLRAKMKNAVERKREKMRLHQERREARIQALQAKASQAEGEVRRREQALIDQLQRQYAERASAG